jgi:hypothetical protein
MSSRNFAVSRNDKQQASEAKKKTTKTPNKTIKKKRNRSDVATQTVLSRTSAGKKNTLLEIMLEDPQLHPLLQEMIDNESSDDEETESDPSSTTDDNLDFSGEYVERSQTTTPRETAIMTTSQTFPGTPSLSALIAQHNSRGLFDSQPMSFSDETFSFLSAAYDNLRMNRYHHIHDASFISSENSTVSTPEWVTLLKTKINKDVAVKSDTNETEKCQICFERVRRVVSHPCGHRMSCVRCAIDLYEKRINKTSNSVKCPFCNTGVTAATVVFD